VKQRIRGKKRIHGKLDPLLDCLPNPPVETLSEKLEVTRQSIHRWQANIVVVSPMNRMKINMLCIAYGIDQIF
jgi:hypothetical protein